MKRMMEYAKLYNLRPASKKIKNNKHKMPKWLRNKKRRPNMTGGTIAQRATDMRSNPTRHEEMFMRILPRKFQGRYAFQHVMAPYIVDFYFWKEKLAVEIDGPSHFQQIEYDRNRDERIRLRYGAKVIRFLNSDVESRSKNVLDRLHRALKYQASEASESRFPRVVSAPSPKGGTPENRVESREHAAQVAKVHQPLDS